jgi:alpha-1,3-mannosyltransferase
MRILHVVRQYAPAVGGLESYVRSMVTRQQAAGHECEVLTLNKVFHGDVGDLPAQESIDGVSIRRVPFIGFRRFFLPLISPSYFSKFDIIHVHNTDVFYDYIAALSFFVKTPIFATTHGGFFHTKNFSLIKKLYFNSITRFSTARYNTLFAISGNDFKHFEGMNDNIVMQPNAIEPIGSFISEGEDFVYLGRLAPHKKVERLIETHAKLVKDHGITAKLRIIGPEWEVTQESLAVLAENLGISDYVIFHGTLAPQDMPGVMHECRYFVSASTYEGFGMSMLEGMSVGLVPFVQPNEAFKELIDLAKVGACVPFDEPERAAAIIAATIPGVTKDTQKKAQAFSALYSWDKLVASSLQSYADALE